MRILDLCGVFGLALLLTVSACQEPEGIGLEVLPDGEQIPIAWIDTFTLEARTQRFDSLLTSGLNSGTYLIGDFGDPLFGRVRSELFTQFKTGTSELDFGSGATLDSIVLNMAYTGSFGYTDKLRGTMKFGVYELDEDLYSTAAGDSTYFSTSTHNVISTPLAVIEFRPDLYADVGTGLDTVPPSLRITLDPSLGTRIINSLNLASDEVFITEFKGLNIKPINDQMPSGFGSILYFNMASGNTRVELFYHNDDEDSLRHIFPIQNSYGIHTRFTHNFPIEINHAIADTTEAGAERLYIRSMAGLRMKVEMPYLRELNQLGVVAINKAELVVPLDESEIDQFGSPSVLRATGINAGDSAVFLIDFFELNGVDYYGGLYDADNKEYVFNIARHVQSLLNSPEEPDYGLYIVNSSNAVNAQRGIFNGPQHPTKPLRLRMTYTILE